MRSPALALLLGWRTRLSESRGTRTPPDSDLIKFIFQFRWAYTYTRAGCLPSSAPTHVLLASGMLAQLGPISRKSLLSASRARLLSKSAGAELFRARSVSKSNLRSCICMINAYYVFLIFVASVSAFIRRPVVPRDTESNCRQMKISKRHIRKSAARDDLFSRVLFTGWSFRGTCKINVESRFQVEVVS